MDRARGLGRHVARDPPREGELTAELAQPLLVLRHARIELAVRALEVRVRDQSGPTVPGPRDVDRAQVAGSDRPVQVRVDQVETGRRPEVAEQAGLHVLRSERLAQERVVEQIDLPDREVVRSPPVRVEQPQLLASE